MIPQVYRVLADPDAGHSLMRAPRGGDAVEVTTSYWQAAVHLMVYGLGWVSIDRGLTAWRDAGHPTDSTQLELLASIWHEDGMLDWLHAWAKGEGGAVLIQETVHVLGPAESNKPSPDDLRFIAQQEAAIEASGMEGPLVGGFDPLHLARHCFGPIEPVADTAAIHITGDRKAALLVDTMVGWHHTLITLGQQLPNLGDRSWYVEVLVRTVGTLGVYRRSRQTGRWFAGPHRHHTLGA